MTEKFLGYSTEGLTKEDVAWLKKLLEEPDWLFSRFIEYFENDGKTLNESTLLSFTKVAQWLHNKPEATREEVREFIKRYKKQSVVTVSNMLEERGARYGDFCGHAKITMDLKRAMHASKNWETLSDDKKECLDMVAHKIGRILNGDPEYKDSWEDCIGYLTLVTNKLKGL